jgi:hypothetical protein
MVHTTIHMYMAAMYVAVNMSCIVPLKCRISEGEKTEEM